MAVQKIMEYHTLHLRSRILEDVIKELDTKELCVTKMIISADKNIETKLEHYPIPELDRYFGGSMIDRKSQERKRIVTRVLRIEKDIIERIEQKVLASKDGIDLEYVNKVLTNPPYDFPYVRVEEIGRAHV